MTISKEADGQSHNKGHTFYAEFNLVCARFVAVEQEEEEEEVQEQEEEEKEEKTMRARIKDPYILKILNSFNCIGYEDPES